MTHEALVERLRGSAGGGGPAGSGGFADGASSWLDADSEADSEADWTASGDEDHAVDVDGAADPAAAAAPPQSPAPAIFLALTVERRAHHPLRGHAPEAVVASRAHAKVRRPTLFPVASVFSPC